MASSFDLTPEDLAEIDRSHEEIDVGQYRPELEELLGRYGLPPESLVLVPSIRDWAAANGCLENDAFRTGMAVSGGRFDPGVIVLRSPLTRGFQGRTSSIDYLGLIRYQWVTKTFPRAVKHLVLHEIAHLRGMMQEQEADEWAFRELRSLEGLPEGIGRDE